jgi:hypothetical protein
MLSLSKHDCGNGSILLSHFDMLSVTWIEHWVHLFIGTMSQHNALFFRRFLSKFLAVGSYNRTLTPPQAVGHPQGGCGHVSTAVLCASRHRPESTHR